MRGSFDFTRSGVFITGVVIVLLAFLLSPAFTGWFTNVMRMDIGIGSQDRACLYFIESPGSNIIQDSDVNLTVEISNCGSTDLDGKVVIEIVDSLNRTVDYLNSSNYSLNPSQYYIFNTTWTANPSPGDYVIYAWDQNYNANDTNRINQSFEVRCLLGTYKCFGNELRYCDNQTSWDYYTTCSYACTSGACVSGPGAPSEPGVTPGGPILIARMDLEHDEHVEVPMDSEYTVLIKVINNGTAVLYNISLSASYDGIGIESPDMVIERLSPNSSAFFVLDVNTTGSALGNHTLDFEVRSVQDSASGRIIIDVVSPYDDRTACENMISYYLDMLDTMNQEAKIMELRGMNVSELKGLIAETANDIEAAKEYLRLGVYSKCVDLTPPIREKIERIAEIIVTIITREDITKHVTAQPGIPYWVYLIIAGVLITILVIAGIRVFREYMRKHRLISIRHEW